MSLLRRHAKVVLAAAVVAIAGVVFVLVWFQPQKVVIEKRVNESAPTAQPMQAKAARARPMSASFRSLEHQTTGKAVLYSSGGKRYVRFEDFETSNGPDVVVYLSSSNANAEWRDFAKDFVDLGPLKGNVGNQNYAVPHSTDLERYHTVVVWCRRFTVPFAAAQFS